MGISYGTIWKLAALLALAAICALLYLKFWRADDVPAFVKSIRPVARAPAFDPDVVRLSALVDDHLEAILSPLTAHAPALPRQEIAVLRLKFLEIIRRTSPGERATYQTAVQLCETLLLAIQERERSSASLADTRSKPHAAAMSANQKKELEGKQRFFEAGVERYWLENSKTYRAQVVNLRGRLRDEQQRLIGQSSDSK